MPKRRINLNALTGFEAAARLLSFTAAANELNVTQGAVSRQIASIERTVGTPLFRRMTRRIVLTEAGQQFYATVSSALNTIEHGLSDLTAGTRTKPITISILPTLGAVWLMPKLHQFTHANPGMEVRMVTSIEPADFASGEVDIAVRVGCLPQDRHRRSAPRINLRMTTNWANVSATELFPDTLVPVVARRLYRDYAGMPLATLLNSVPLIHTTTRADGWSDWLKAHRIHIAARHKRLELGHFFMAIEEARAGHGICLVPDVLLLDHEHRHQLHVIDAGLTPSAGSYYALTEKERLSDRTIQTFLGWLSHESMRLRTRLAPGRKVGPGNPG